MPLAAGQKIIITSADGTKRRRMPSAQIMDAKARVERYGGAVSQASSGLAH